MGNGHGGSGMTEEKPMEEVRILVEQRGGKTYISSEDVPGLWIWGDNPDDVFGSVISTIELLYKHNRQLEVKARAVRPQTQDRFSGVERVSHIYHIYRITPEASTGGHGRQTMGR